MGIIQKIFGDANLKEIKAIEPLVLEINALEEAAKAMSQEELRAQTAGWQAELKKSDGEELKAKIEQILPRAFAAAREAGHRVLDQRHYDVQLVGGVVLHQGKIAEMKTGEGKTLVATLPLYLNALAGRGAHLVTVNDYLAKIGAGWMAPVYHYLGLSTGVIVHEGGLLYDPEYSDENLYDPRLRNFRPVERSEAYAADITYGTNNEYGFDYLRDNMAPSLERMVQRELFYAIVDEIDSILIDEARTPLIISAPAEESTDKYFQFAELVRRLKENEDYNVDEKMRAATLSDNGISKMEKWLNVDNIYTERGIREVHHIEQALKAHAIFKRDKDYVVQEGEVIIVDEFTGRLMHGRRYSEGLHQAIEAKEGVAVQRESQTLATVTFQNFFRMYFKLSGMTGTAVTEAEEFAKIYSLETVIIPTHKPNVRKDFNDLIYKSEEAKFSAVIADVKERHLSGQPILIGTISIEKNEFLSGLMERQGLKPNVLNAKNHEKEARFIAEAGQKGAITIATNMAGRGVDIMLGGAKPESDSPQYPAWKEAHEQVKERGGLHVIGTERHESRRIDNQLRGRAARQGDPGSSQFFVSVDDDLMRIFGGDRMKSIMNTLNMPDDMPIENKLISRSLESAQKKVEGNNFDVRKHLVEYDDVINKHRETIYRKRREALLLHERFKQENDPEYVPPISNFQFLISKYSLKHPNLKEQILDMVETEIEQVVSFHTVPEYIKEWNLDEIKETAVTIFPVKDDLAAKLEGFVKSGNGKLDKASARTGIIEYLSGQAREAYEKIETKARELGVDWPETEKGVFIRSVDTLWVEHLEAMASLRQGIGLRGYGQRDPLIEYKKEAFRQFSELSTLIQKEVAYSIFKVAKNLENLSAFSAPSLMERARHFSAPAKTMAAGLSQPALPGKPRDAAGAKVGRNDPCPCGSGKKYKKCHGK